MTIDIQSFDDAMTQCWETELGNRSSKEIPAVWSQMARTFNDQIERSNSKIWQVLQPPTGTGKSKGAELYCSMLAPLSTQSTIENIVNPSSAPRLHPGVLLVTRLIDEADDRAARINKLAGCETAQAHHSKNKLSTTEMASTPVLIITHSAYRLALIDASSDAGHDAQMLHFHAWLHTERSLIIIDEAPDLIEPTQLDIDRLKEVLGFIPEAIVEQFSSEVGYLDKLIRWIRALPSEGGREQMLPRHNMLSEQPDFTPLRKAMRKRSLDQVIVKRRDGDEIKSLQKTITDTLDSIEALAGNWRLYAQSGEKRTLNFARLILPQDHPGAVILDATASTHLLYRLLEDRVSVIPAPKGVRRYNNVTLHVSRDHRVGKGFLKDHAETECRKLVDELQNVTRNSKGVFICCHKDVDPILVKYPGYEVGHWGAVDGQNKWQECDTAVIFGLPFRDNIWAANTYMAVHGPQTTEWFKATGNRPFRDYSDILYELDTNMISTNIIQAINRVRCRRVIDEYGNCPSTDVYILLPSSKRADDILEHIVKSMPGIEVVDWVFSGAKRKPRKLKYADSLISYLEKAMSGRILVRDVSKDLVIPKSSFEKLVPKFRDGTSDICKELTSLGIKYQVEGSGRGATSYFLKP